MKTVAHELLVDNSQQPIGVTRVFHPKANRVIPTAGEFKNLRDLYMLRDCELGELMDFFRDEQYLAELHRCRRITLLVGDVEQDMFGSRTVLIDEACILLPSWTKDAEAATRAFTYALHEVRSMLTNEACLPWMTLYGHAAVEIECAGRGVGDGATLILGRRHKGKIKPAGDPMVYAPNLLRAVFRGSSEIAVAPISDPSRAIGSRYGRPRQNGHGVRALCEPSYNAAWFATAKSLAPADVRVVHAGRRRKIRYQAGGGK